MSEELMPEQRAKARARGCFMAICAVGDDVIDMDECLRDIEAKALTAILAAVEQERERCAKIVEERAKDWDDDIQAAGAAEDATSSTAHLIEARRDWLEAAAAIRSEKGEPT